MHIKNGKYILSIPIKGGLVPVTNKGLQLLKLMVCECKPKVGPWMGTVKWDTFTLAFTHSFNLVLQMGSTIHR